MRADDEAVSYRKRLSHLADASDARVFFNRKVGHEAIAIATVIEKSSNYIYVITDDLESGIYCTSDVMSSVRGFVEKNPTSDIKVISRKPIPTSHPWRSDPFLVDHQEQMFFLTLPDKWNISYYFVLGDGKNFRYEHENKNYVPIVQFGNTKMGDHLKVKFEEQEVELKERNRHKAA